MEAAVRTFVLPELANDLFWETLLHLIIFKRAAFITGAAAIEHLAKDGTLNFNVDSVKQLKTHLQDTHPESITKLANIILPLLKTEKQVEEMFSNLSIGNEVTILTALLKVDSPLSYYLIFKYLKMIDDKGIARKCSLALMKRKDDMAFNAVSLIKTYWFIDDLPARFSLNIEEYELNHIDRSFDNFINIISGKRPKI